MVMKKKEHVVNRLLALMNLRLSRLSLAVTDSRDVKFGPYIITVTPESTLPRAYRTHPEFNAAIGRVVAAVQAKYPSMTCIDVGANAGDTTAIIKCQADLPVIAVEGDEQTFAMLKKNMSQFKNVDLV